MSNKDSDEEGKGDPIETLLYAVFVASSERASVAELANILSVDVSKLQMAISIACRLGFGTRLNPTSPGKLLSSQLSQTLTHHSYKSVTNPLLPQVEPFAIVAGCCCYCWLLHRFA